MSDELKPCPFCGANDASLSFDEIVSCSNCGATANNKIDWNLRATPSPDQSDRERARMFLSGLHIEGDDGINRGPIDPQSVLFSLASLLAEVRAEERERIEVILKVLLDDLDIGEQYDKPGGMKPTCHPPLSRMLPTHRNHIRRMITAIRGMK